jgi:hypothetical protein
MDLRQLQSPPLRFTEAPLRDLTCVASEHAGQRLSPRTQCAHIGIMRVIEDHLRPSGHIMPDHAGDRGAELLVLAPHDHLHINQIRVGSDLLAETSRTPLLALRLETI